MSIILDCPEDTPLDSKLGVEVLYDYARKTGFFLNGYHADLGEKYGVPADGVRFIGRLPEWPI